MTRILINNIKISLLEDETNIFSQAKKILRKSGVDPSAFRFSINKKSIDARDKNNIILVYTILAVSDKQIKIPFSSQIKPYESSDLTIEYGSATLKTAPVVVGMGPAGMFCALLLAEHGYNPIIIDRGDCVADRIKTLNNFLTTGNLDLDSNIQFGAGGAGTFSDGKLTTRINDSRCSYVLSRFVDFGAPEEILTKSKPHIGTDILTNVVDNILHKIQELGGTVIYRCKMDDILLSDFSVNILTTKGSFETENLVLALGHSARDTYKMLLKKDIFIEPKPFSIGVRIEHLKEDIDTALYGKYAGHPKLGAGEYNLSDTTKERGVYTFCMCPGGEVVPATSQEFGVCVNGMSKHARDGRNSNCAVNVSIFKEDYGNNPHKAIEYQENLEKSAYSAAGGNYYAPIQLMEDFLNDRAVKSPSRILPTYANGNRVTVCNMGNILPEYVTQRLREGFVSFDKRIKGFAVSDAVLTGIETRTSAPIRITRNENLTSLSNPCIYPCGEGAGYAGGIMSSAIDGIKVAIEIMKKYKPQ